MRKVPDRIESLTVKQQAIVPALGLGFMKSRLPEPVRRAIGEHFNRSRQWSRPEQRSEYLQPTEEEKIPSLLIEDAELNREILDALRPLHEQWAGMTLRGTACYGIRVYLKGSYLYNHVDRIDTHVISSTICVDHDLASPWPLYIEDLDGVPHEVDLAPGDIVFYESARLKHGRPYPLQGEFYAGIFVHYAPVDWPYTTGRPAVTGALQYLYYNTYGSGRAGLSNGIMSVEIGVILSALMNRQLVLEGNISPTANVVEYRELAGEARSRITDLFDLPVPWTDADTCNVRDLPTMELSPTNLWNAVFYYPQGLDTTSEDFRAFARGRECWLTYGDDLAASPVVSLSGGPDTLYNLSFYSYFFYLDAPARRRVEDTLRAMTPKRPLAEFAGRVARGLGAFNALHLRRGDFKQTYGVTTRDRRPEHALEVLDQNFSRDDVLLILTDERDDPFFDEIRRAYTRSVFVDDLIRREHSADFAQLPCRDSIAIAFLSQLIATDAKDFVGTMTSTFTALIQRYRGNRGAGRDFKFLWNELPDEGSPLERGSHAFSDCVPMARGVMVDQFDGPYSWNRVNQRINPAWMREWPEAFLSPRALNETSEDVPPAITGSPALVRGERDRLFIRFGDDQVEVVAPALEVREAIKARFRPMIAARDGRLVGTVTAHREGGAWLVKDHDGTCPAATLSDLQNIVHRAVVRAFMRARTDLVWLHAAALEHAGRALVLVGPWGHGKSVLSASLLGLRWKYLSDDIVPVDPATLAVHPFPKTLRRREHASGPLDTEGVARLAKRDVPLRSEDIAGQPAVCGGVVFPKFDCDAPTRLSPCRAPFAVLELLPGCLSFSQHREAALAFAGALVQAVPTFHLSFHDSRVAAELLTEQFALSPAGR